jgi:PAS domain-containing protein
MTFGMALALFLISFLAALGVVVAVARLAPRRSLDGASLFHDRPESPVFLFDDETLLDASDTARAFLAAVRARGTAWHKFLSWAGPRFPDLEAELLRLPEKGRLHIAARGSDPTVLVAEWRGGLRRIEIVDSNLGGGAPLVDTISNRAAQEELANLREVADAAPFPIWSEDESHRILWANAAYLALTTAQTDETELASWPLPRLFAVQSDCARQRISLTLKNAQHWFDCHQIPARDGHLTYAIPADPVVHAENALRAFVQTLTKTFAQLPIGLAIFDAQRKMQLFNPALTDLTGLPVGFLSARPSLFSFLDAMRERQMIPEPRDYKSWRARMAALEQSSVDGSYDETWMLASGATYQVSGRPHPEGGLALLIRDISDDIQRARRARAETELSQAVIDVLDEAVAVFSSSGDLLIANAAYVRLWEHDPQASIETATIATLAAKWRAATGPASVWTLAEAFALAPSPREPWTFEARLRDGRHVTCRLVPLPGGATMIGFRLSHSRAEDDGLAAPETADLPKTAFG